MFLAMLYKFAWSQIWGLFWVNCTTLLILLNTTSPVRATDVCHTARHWYLLHSEGSCPNATEGAHSSSSHFVFLLNLNRPWGVIAGFLVAFSTWGARRKISAVTTWLSHQLSTCVIPCTRLRGKSWRYAPFSPPFFLPYHPYYALFLSKGKVDLGKCAVQVTTHI